MNHNWKVLRWSFFGDLGLLIVLANLWKTAEWI